VPKQIKEESERAIVTEIVTFRSWRPPPLGDDINKYVCGGGDPFITRL
jgi:hypothetical protein